MTRDREFEAWASTLDLDLKVVTFPGFDSMYSDCNTDYAWRSWQASRKQALTEAMTLCEKQGTHEEDMGRSKEAFGCDLCVEALANLINPEGEPS